VIYRKMSGTEGQHVNQNKTDPKRQLLHSFSDMWILQKRKKDDLKLEETLLGEGEDDWGKTEERGGQG
jgi:hypothetical protein